MYNLEKNSMWVHAHTYVPARASACAHTKHSISVRINPVSYTHLDVYKRQKIYNPHYHLIIYHKSVRKQSISKNTVHIIKCS